jgi:transcriptional regulator with XRE-family HTH domain
MGYKNERLINTIELGRAIKRRREELSLSLRDVADLTEVSASTLSRIENGTGKPDADNIARITNWLDAKRGQFGFGFWILGFGFFFPHPNLVL